MYHDLLQSSDCKITYNINFNIYRISLTMTEVKISWKYYVSWKRIASSFRIIFQN